MDQGCALALPGGRWGSSQFVSLGPGEAGELGEAGPGDAVVELGDAVEPGALVPVELTIGKELLDEPW